MSLAEKIQNHKNEAISQILRAENRNDLEDIRISYLGRKGKINLLFKEMAGLEPEERTQIGRLINEVKQAISGALDRAEGLTLAQKKDSLEKWLDITAPGIKPALGHLHLITQAIEEISTIFQKLGFVRVRHPEVEWDHYAFENLNMPTDHPARDDFETFYIEAPLSAKYGRMLLTPHTSSGQVREMEAFKPPIKTINIGKCYRPNYDISHTPMFHQFEGLLIDKGINITHLKGTCDYFARQYFGPKRQTRLRPFHFQFTEPSFEIDISCEICRGKGCRLCKEGWLELGGAGMVHPNVLKSGNIDSKEYSGFAFGWGIERVLMMKSGLELPDLRLIYSTDLRILNQF